MMWEKANKCPQCGGKMVLCEHFTVTHHYHIKRDGQPSKRYRRESHERTNPDRITVFCENCRAFWDEDNVMCETNGVYVWGRGK